MQYYLKYIDTVKYWVDAENEIEALVKPVPEIGHRVSIEIITKGVRKKDEN